MSTTLHALSKSCWIEVAAVLALSWGGLCRIGVPPAAIHDSKAHLRERAIRDERISLPLSAFKDLDTIYPKLRAQFGSHNAMVEVKMNWRCTNEIWWSALITDEALAERCYRKLGYADAAGEVVKIREGRLAQGSQPVPASAMTSQPQLTVENVISVASDNYKRQHYSTKFAHVFWGKLECGLVLSSVSPWEYVPKEHGIRAAGGFACKYCGGFWKGSKGSSRVVQLMGRSAGKQLSLQLILDEPPEKLWQQWIKDRMEYYLRVEPVDAIRDEALDHSYPVEERLRFSIRNGLGTVSDLIWSILLSNPERDGLLQIQKLAAKKIRPQWQAGTISNRCAVRTDPGQPKATKDCTWSRSVLALLGRISKPTLLRPDWLSSSAAKSVLAAEGMIVLQHPSLFSLGPAFRITFSGWFSVALVGCSFILLEFRICSLWNWFEFVTCFFSYSTGIACWGGLASGFEYLNLAQFPIFQAQYSK